MTNFNERTNTLLYKKYISHTLFLKGLMLVVCKRWAGDRDRLLYWPSSTSFSSCLGCSTVSHWGPKTLCLPLALNLASCLQLTQTVCALVILLFNAHLLPLFFRLLTQVHLLIDGSIEGQSITLFERHEPTSLNATYVHLSQLWRCAWHNVYHCWK